MVMIAGLETFLFINIIYYNNYSGKSIHRNEISMFIHILTGILVCNLELIIHMGDST